MDKQFKNNLEKALTEFKYSKLTEIEIAKRNHISQVTLSKYVHLNNITRKHSLYGTPKKPAKRVSNVLKQQQYMQKARKYIRHLSISNASKIIHYIGQLQDTRINKIKANIKRIKSEQAKRDKKSQSN